MDKRFVVINEHHGGKVGSFDNIEEAGYAADEDQKRNLFRTRYSIIDTETFRVIPIKHEAFKK